MKDILKLKSTDSTLNNVFKEYPFYIDIKGSVSICLIKCAQEIEECREIKFSSMNNNGKYLLLNPNQNTPAKCNIKLAFDSNNDTINDEGEAKYKFEKAFVTVPSLHRINGKLADLETFLIFSSVQKNGNILYIVLCTLSNGVNNVPSEPSKLLNYKLMDELFTGGSGIPEINGTKPASDISIDLTNFIPVKGDRNFYDYVHPNNPEVNFRVFQNQLSVSNDCLAKLKEKLTPGNSYSDFSLAISQNINPQENLFFYFSQDLTKNYESFSSNKQKEHLSNQFEDLQKTLYDIDQSKKKKKESFLGDDDDDIKHQTNLMEESEEETIDHVSQLKKIKIDDHENKEKFINCCKSSSSDKNTIKVYKIDVASGKVLKAYENMDDALAMNKTYQLEELSEAIDNYPYETYKGFYWRIKSQFNLYSSDQEYDNEIDTCKEDGLGKYNLNKEEKEFSSDFEQEYLIENLAAYILNKKFSINESENQITNQDCINAFNAMKNFPYEKYGKYYIQNVYSAYGVQITPISKILVIFIFWSLIIISFVFYRMNYHLLNGNYNSKLNMDENSILNNDILHSLASQRFRIVFLLALVTIIGSFYTIGYSLTDLSIQSNNVFPFIGSITMLISYFIMSYVCKRLTYGSLNYVSTAEESSIGIFLKENIGNDNSLTDKITQYLKNMGKLLVFKNEQDSRNIFPSLDCIFMNIKSIPSNKNEKNEKNKNNSEKEGPSAENIEKHIPSIFTSHPSAPLAGGDSNSPPNPLPGDNSFPNGNSSHVTSVNEIHEDQNFDPYVEEYAKTSLVKTIAYNAVFYIFSNLIQKYIQDLAVKYNNDTNSNGFIKWIFDINYGFYYATSYVTLKPAIQYFLQYLWKPINNLIVKYPTIFYGLCGLLLLGASITCFVFFGISRSNQANYLTSAIIFLIAFALIVAQYLGYFDSFPKVLIPLMIIVGILCIWYLKLILNFVIDLFTGKLNPQTSIYVIIVLLVLAYLLIMPFFSTFYKLSYLSLSSMKDYAGMGLSKISKLPSLSVKQLSSVLGKMSQAITSSISSDSSQGSLSDSSLETQPTLNTSLGHIPSIFSTHNTKTASPLPSPIGGPTSEQIASRIPGIFSEHDTSSEAGPTSQQIASRTPGIFTQYDPSSSQQQSSDNNVNNNSNNNAIPINTRINNIKISTDNGINLVKNIQRNISRKNSLQRTIKKNKNKNKQK